ncbi:ABL188Wp [Eremothecium gossypii ATCC 10895]|uniref:Altered inheritance of mitochondria protein 6 n=1 Tax=Eremothecium gossypii (strain ATCC 10895 / CBS 109.51 / FGSC 9923 / NRRL Y-1056) TaxID=284811 RepID=Q75E58_EREGS|nr:ABL188Wp [Eremothecium gossypii ATCC 10895]AAS50583.1 ABL188Wp [Eremothecium gossypii ATCC 10895]AEY94871.1 FABL188Wp [Eremothecium gossypii FDAG1]
MPFLRPIIYFLLSNIGAALELPGTNSEHLTSFEDDSAVYGMQSTSVPSNFKNTEVHRLTGNVTVHSWVHSHNDYTRDRPLFDAISYGVVSIEADVYLRGNNRLAVAHVPMDVRDAKDLRELYLEHLERLLDEVNQQGQDSWQGIFYKYPTQSLQLLIDLKKDDDKLYTVLMDDYLKPLIDKGYLSYIEIKTEEIVRRPLTVVLTGERPKDQRTVDGDRNEGYFSDGRRYVFIDFEIGRMVCDKALYGPSVLASGNLVLTLAKCLKSMDIGKFASDPTDEQIRCLRNVIKSGTAHMNTRLWGGPSAPDSLRDRLWKLQLEAGINMLNADNLAAAVKIGQEYFG